MFLFDTAALEHALSIPIDSHLRRLLGEHLAHLNTQAFSVADTTYFLIVTAESTTENLIDELGWSPLIDLDGNAFGDDAFAPFHDHLEDRDGWFVMIVSGSNDAAFILFIRDDDGVPAELLALCRQYAGDSL